MIASNKTKLNLGCRNDLLPDYINIDLDEFKGKHDFTFLKMDALELDLYFLSNSIDEVIARQFFEHFSHEEIGILLYKIWKVLKPRGKLEITTPDFYEMITYYKWKHENKNFLDVDVFHSRVFGLEDESFHKTVWYEEMGKFYLLRENLYIMEKITKPTQLEITFIATKLEEDGN